jgi:hypothetical protein
MEQRGVTVTVLSASIPALVLAAALAAPQATPPAAPPAGPEIFDIVATVAAKGSTTGNITVPMTVQLDRYTPEHERTKMTDGLKYNGYPGFLNALRDAPQVGTLDGAGEKFVIRWARTVDNPGGGRTISIVTDTPVYFVGGWRKDAKSKAGYELAVMQLVLDKTGHGEGTMAAAARVKPGGETGVRIDNYAETPMKLKATLRTAK